MNKTLERALLFLVKKTVLEIADWLVADFLIDAVRGRIGEIGVQAAETFAGIQHTLRECRDTGSCVTFSAQGRRRIYCAYADSMSSVASQSRHGDDLSILPNKQ